MDSDQERRCLECEKKLFGRKDKKFCDYHCRNDFHNRLKREGESYMNRVLLILRHNRSILQRHCPEGKTNVKYSDLLREGFSPDYFTGLYTSKSGGNTFKMCFEFGYRAILKEDIQFVIVKFNQLVASP